MSNSYRFNQDRIYSISFSNEKLIKLVDDLLFYQKNDDYEEKQEIIYEIRQCSIVLEAKKFQFVKLNEKLKFNFRWSHRQIQVLLNFVGSNYNDDDNFRLYFEKVLQEALEIEWDR